jgi:tungstate transport system ATP-binding protein
MSLLARAAGRLLFRGEEVLSNGAAVACRRRMALVFQEPLLFDASVYENVASGLKIRGLDRTETRRRALASLRRFRLEHMAERSARKLSGGEARRVNLARALAAEPEVVLLDEPFANLDLPTRQSIASDLERTIRDERMAAVLVTHDQTEALRLSDRIVVMHAGRIVQSDLPSAVVNNPVNEFVASCVGMETILDGTVLRSAGGEIVLAVAGQEVHAVGEGSSGDPVYCCIRPENVVIEVAHPARTSARNVFTARIAGVVSVGPFLKLSLDCGFPLVAHVTVESFASLGLAPGQRVFASFKATALHVIRKAEASSHGP